MDYFSPIPPNINDIVEYPAKITRVSPDDAQYFFGYFDKSPWNSRSELLAHRATISHRQPRYGEAAQVGFLKDGKFTAFAETLAWCWQQGSMLQWFSDDEVIFNDLQDDHYVSHIYNVKSGKITRTYDRAIYCLAPDRSYALSLDFARLDRERPGYGYTGIWHQGLLNAAPNDDGVWKIDLKTGKSTLLLSIRQLRDTFPAHGIYDNTIWVNHLLVSRRFVFLMRYRKVQGSSAMSWETIMITSDSDGKNLHPLNNEGMSSHHSWISNDQVMSYSHRYQYGYQYYIYRDQTFDAEPLVPGKFWGDGHCTESLDGKWVLTDSYPWPGNNMRSLYLLRKSDGTVYELGRFFADPSLPNPARCDLHPRLSADNKTVCFDSVHEGYRGVYFADVSELTKE